MNTTTNTDSRLPLRIYKCKESTEYAKRVMAHLDIVFSIKCLVRLREMNNSSGSDDVVRESLWNAAIIRTFSIFDGQYAIKLKILEQLPEGAKGAYKFFRNYRSKHISHKVNPVDQIKSGIILSDPDSGKREVLGVGNLAMQDASYSEPEYVNCLGKFLDALKKEIELWRERMLKAAKDSDIDGLYKLHTLRVVVPESGYLHKGT